MDIMTDEEITALGALGISSSGLLNPTDIYGWYRWKDDNEYGYTTFLSCAGTHMKKIVQGNLDTLLHRIYNYEYGISAEKSLECISAILVPEPENQYDPDAIRVTRLVNDHILGYIPGKAGGYLNPPHLGGETTDGNRGV